MLNNSTDKLIWFDSVPAKPGDVSLPIPNWEITGIF